MIGTFVAVVGPSGVGKDTLIRAAVQHQPDLMAARRVISRPADDVTEIFESVSESDFARRRRAGEFALTWQAHEVSYAIPASVDQPLAAGRHVLANLSRGTVGEARDRFTPFLAVLVTAPLDILANRLAVRGREGACEIRARLGRAGFSALEGPDVVVVGNGGTREDGITAFLSALPPQPLIAYRRRM